MGRGLLALVGLAVALLGSSPFKSDFKSSSEPTNVLVWVNQQPITLKQVNFAAQRLTGGSPDSLSSEQLRTITQLLIDEELLLQRAETLGFQDADPGTRKALVQAVIDQVVKGFLAKPVNEQQLIQFYRQHQTVFERPLRVAVDVLRLANLQDAERAHALLLAGSDFADVSSSAGTASFFQLPRSPLPAHMLRRYLGSALTDVVLSLNQGDISDPIIRPGGVYLLRANIVQLGWVPPFREVRLDVESEYRRRGRDQALDTTLANLWKTADIDTNPLVKDGLPLTVQTKPFLSEIALNVTGDEDTD